MYNKTIEINAVIPRGMSFADNIRKIREYARLLEELSEEHNCDCTLRIDVK